MWTKSTLAGAEAAIEAFGRRLREGRRRASMTQMLLEEHSGVDQSLISRLELGGAPHASLERVVRLGQALGDDFPLGYCPHQHRCLYRPDWAPPPWEGHLPYQRAARDTLPTAMETDEVLATEPTAAIVADMLLEADDDYSINVRLSDLSLTPMP